MPSHAWFDHITGSLMLTAPGQDPNKPRLQPILTPKATQQKNIA